MVAYWSLLSGSSQIHYRFGKSTVGLHGEAGKYSVYVNSECIPIKFTTTKVKHTCTVT